MGYKGSDLGSDFKSWFRKEKKRITDILISKGCTDIQLDYGFYYFSGFFTSASGQIYYISSMDWRYFRNADYLIRTAKHYKDYTGGSNGFVKPEGLAYMNIK